jgi:hypothetical protein
MRLESERRRRPSEGLGARQRGVDDSPVTPVNTVEIADGDDCAGEGGGRRIVLDEHERFGRREGCGHAAIGGMEAAGRCSRVETQVKRADADRGAWDEGGGRDSPAVGLTSYGFSRNPD